MVKLVASKTPALRVRSIVHRAPCPPSLPPSQALTCAAPPPSCPPTHLLRPWRTPRCETQQNACAALTGIISAVPGGREGAAAAGAAEALTVRQP